MVTVNKTWLIVHVTPRVSVGEQRLHKLLTLDTERHLTFRLDTLSKPLQPTSRVIEYSLTHLSIIRLP